MNVDDLRYSPHLAHEFERHRKDWEEGRIRLEDHCEEYRETRDGLYRPIWYGGRLGGKVFVDKAKFFEAAGYRPSYPACRFHASRARFRVFSGGARAGKSYAGGMDCCPVLLTPGTQTWLVGPEYGQCEKELLYIIENTVEHPVISKQWDLGTLAASKNGGRVVCRPKDGDMEIRLAWPTGEVSWVRCKSSEKPRSLLSEELDLLLVVEAPLVPADRWRNKLLMRLTTRGGCAILPATPSGSVGWFADIYRKGLSGSNPERYFTVTCDSRMNPTLAPEEIDVMQDQMPDADFVEQVVGRPTPKHGLVYTGFDRGTHVDSWQPDWPRKGWTRHRVFDFGYRDPYVVLWVAEDEDHRFYVYREFYKTKQLTKDVIRHIGDVEGWRVEREENGGLSLEGEPKEEIDGYSIADWAAESRAELQRAGIRCRKAKKEIEDGIRTLQSCLRVQGDGRPGLYVHPSCVETIREFGAYEYDKRSERPKDVDNHSMDALRYVAHTLNPLRSGIKAETV